MDKCRLLCKRLFSWAEDDHIRIDMVIAAVLAFFPVLQHYRAPIYNVALTLMVLFVPYLLLRTIPRLGNYRQSDLDVVAVMIVYLIYRVIDHGTSLEELGQSAVLIIYMVAVAFGCIDVKTLCRTGLLISLSASVLLLLQYIFFYIFQVHLQMVPTSLLLPSAEQWALGAQTGLAGITGKINDFYRPSAFFLEPSHVFIYVFPHLMIQLFGGKSKLSLAAAGVITMGLILSTSGMGIAAAFGSWGLYLILRDEKTGTFSLRNIGRKRNLIMLACLMVMFVLAVIYVPTVRRTVSRIFQSKTGVTAIGGRLNRAMETLGKMTSLQWIVGVEDTTHNISFNMPGLIASLYRHGLIGMVLSVGIYAKSLYRLKLPYAMTGAVILVTSMFSAHTHSTVGMLYYILILMYGFRTQRREESLIKALLKNRNKDQN